MKDRLLFVDIETTGLEADEDLILEVALALVNKDMNIEESISVLIDPESYLIMSREKLEDMCTHIKPDGSVDYIVRDMHRNNGLFDALYSGNEPTWSAVDAENELIDWIDAHGIPRSALPMAGGNVANFDRKFLKEQMPDLEACWHYRNVDISSVKELCRMYNPRVAAAKPKPVGLHRALPDIGDSVAELDFYLDNFLYVSE